MNMSTYHFPGRKLISKTFSVLLTNFFLFLLCITGSFYSSAQTDSVYWSFGVPGTAVANATFSSYTDVPANNCIADTGNVSGAFTSASGYTTLYFTTQFPSSGYPGASGEPTIRNNARSGGFNASTSTYFSFTIGPNTNTSVEIKEINFAGLKNATGPTAYTIRTSLDGYSSTIATGSFATSYGSSKKIHTGLSLQGIMGNPVTIRIYVHNPLVQSTGGNVFIDDVVIYYDATTFVPPGINTGSISGSPFCSGANITIPYTITGIFNSGNVFTAQLSDAGGFFTSPVNIGTLNSTTGGNINAVIPINTPVGSGYRVRIVSSNPSITGADNGANLTIVPSVTPTVTISANPGSTICAGSSAAFTASVINGGSSPVYQWKKNTNNVGTNSNTYTDNGLLNGDNIAVELTSNATCAMPAVVTASAINMTVEPLLVPSVTIAASHTNPVCAGTSVTFTATPVNGGTTPSFQWKKNNINVGGNSDTYVDNALNNGDIVTVEMTSSINCVTASTVSGNNINMVVTPNVIPSVFITANPGEDICEGSSVTFTAAPINGGASPIYQWKVNGNNVGTNNNSFTSTTMSDGNIVTVEIISSQLCAIGVPTPSNAVKMNVSPTTPPAALLTVQPADTIVPGQMVTFTLYIADGGSSPVITWLKNGVEIQGVNGNVYASNALSNSDTIKCFVQSSNSCANPETTTSNAYIIKHIGTGTIHQENIRSLRLYPNPNNGNFTIEGNIYSVGEVRMQIRNVLGQTIYKGVLTPRNNAISNQITMLNVAKGSYLLILSTEEESSALHFIVR